MVWAKGKVASCLLDSWPPICLLLIADLPVAVTVRLQLTNRDDASRSASSVRVMFMQQKW